jgi:predicted MFS family arabinose efflux permease
VSPDRAPSRRWRLVTYVLGLALGAWIGTHAEGRATTGLDWLVLAALLVGAAVALVAPDRGRPLTRRELEQAIARYVAEKARRFPDG